MRLILHIDLNQFFVQVELNRHPEYRGKPTAVGGGVRGVIATASYEARAFGVSSGMALARARELCPDLILIPGHHSDYARISREFFSHVRDFFTQVEMASIDECYADATERWGNLDRTALRSAAFDLQMDLLNATDLKCSMGLAHTRFMAKMGSDLEKPLGLVLLLDEDDWRTRIWPLPISKMYGIGKMTAPRLQEAGVETIGDLVTEDNPRVREILGSMYDYCLLEVQGGGSDSVVTQRAQRKSRSCDITLDQDTTDYDELRGHIVECSEEICADMKRLHLTSSTVCVKLRNSSFVTRSKRETFDGYSNDPETVAYRALSIFDGFYKGEPVRLVGVSCEDLQPEGERKRPEAVQMTLLDAAGGDPR